MNGLAFPLAAALLLPAVPAGGAAAAEEAPNKARLQLLAATCLTCHSAASPDAAIPPLGALSAARIQRLLETYRADRGPGAVMNNISKALNNEEIAQLSRMLGREAR